MTGKERLESFLREQRVPFESQQHPVAFTAQDVAASEHIPTMMMAKVAIAFADAHLVMLVLPSSHRVDLARVGRAIGATDAYLAGEREIAVAFPDCDVGAMPPFGNLYNIPVYVDRRLVEDNTIVFQAGTHTATISIKYADYARVVKPIVADFARHTQEIVASVG
jgi:Ala-tRNA(Pro) deacylase